MGKLVDVGAVGSYFESLSDPRHTRNRKHLLVDVVVVAVCAIVSGCDGPTGIHRWAAERESWLRDYLAMPNGQGQRTSKQNVVPVDLRVSMANSTKHELQTRMAQDGFQGGETPGSAASPLRITG